MWDRRVTGMVSPKKSGEVDGFDLVRAVRHVKDQGKDPSVRAPGPEKPAPASTSPPGGRVAKVRQTAIPTKTEIVCYECGYTFPIAGKVQTLYCPKCRTILEKGDVSITGDHSEPVKTTGRVVVEPEGRVRDTEIIAREIVVRGGVERAMLRGYQKVILDAGAKVPWGCLQTPLLVVAAGADHTYAEPVEAERVEIAGTFTATLRASRVAVKAGGHLRGRVVTPHLSVEDGGGLTASLEVVPEAEPEPPPKPKAVTGRSGR